MTKLECWAEVNPDQTLTVPPEIAAQLPQEQRVRVILLIPDADDAREWTNLAAEQFLKGYAASDAIYDELHAG